MILAQVRDEMNQVNHVLDEFESIHGWFYGRRRKAELLERATRASIRGVEALLEEQWTREPASLYEGNEYTVAEARAMAEAMRQDEALLKAFVAAECRLLQDIGLRPEAVDRVRGSLEDVLRALNLEAAGEPVVEPLERLLRTLQEDLGALQHAAEHDLTIRRLTGTLEALGGGLIVVADGLVIVGTIPSTGGLSLAGAKFSGGAGVGMMSRGAKRAVDT